MKNLLNIALVAVIFIVLGCKCQETLDKIKQGSSSPSPTASSSPTESPTSSPTETPSKSDTTSNTTSSSSSGVSKASFDSMRTGMTLSKVNDIIGFRGTEMSRNKGGGKVFTSYKWEGKDYSIITAVFEDEILKSKYEANLK